jgi:hypothetical protein
MQRQRQHLALTDTPLVLQQLLESRKVGGLLLLRGAILLLLLPLLLL